MPRAPDMRLEFYKEKDFCRRLICGSSLYAQTTQYSLIRFGIVGLVALVGMWGGGQYMIGHKQLQYYRASHPEATYEEMAKATPDATFLSTDASLMLTGISLGVLGYIGLSILGYQVGHRNVKDRHNTS